MASYSGKTIQEAVEKGLSDLALSKDEVDIQVVQQPKNGFFGIGRKLAQVKLTEKSDSKIEPKDVKQTSQQNEPVASKHNDPESKKEKSLNAFDVQDKALDYLKTVISAMGFDVDLNMTVKNNHYGYIDIKTEEESRLIGRHGRTINSLQTLLQIYINRLGANNVNFELDTANYRARRADALKLLAEKTARNAIANGKPVYLNPMPSFERKQIHTALASNNYVVTYSTGREPHRVIVVAPK